VAGVRGKAPALRCMHIILTLGKLIQEVLKDKASLGYIAIPSLRTPKNNNNFFFNAS
jgi:hypothetical protein